MRLWDAFGASWGLTIRLLEPLGASWSLPGSLPGTSWGVPGPLGAFRGASRGPLGASRGLPGELLARLGTLLAQSFVKIDVAIHVGLQEGAQRMPRGSQEGAQSRPRGSHFGSQEGSKTGQKSTSKTKTKKKPLGNLLGHFWACLNSFWEPPGVQNSSNSIGFASICKKTTFLNTKRVRGRSKTHQEPKMIPKRSPRVTQGGARDD